MFHSAAGHYDSFMGRYTVPLAAALADRAQVRSGMHVVDVGCGPGGLAAELASRVGAEHVAAIDPAPQFAAACRERLPAADVRDGVAEELPWEDASFDAALSCLVLAFMRDADAGVREMARVSRPGGTVAACMWDLQQSGMTMLRLFWTVRSRPRDNGGRAGDLSELTHHRRREIARPQSRSPTAQRRMPTATRNTSVRTTDSTREGRQPRRLEKKKSTAGRYPPACAGNLWGAAHRTSARPGAGAPGRGFDHALSRRWRRQPCPRGRSCRPSGAASG